MMQIDQIRMRRLLPPGQPLAAQNGYGLHVDVDERTMSHDTCEWCPETSQLVGLMDRYPNRLLSCLW
jgi:hypothetical protein